MSQSKRHKSRKRSICDALSDDEESRPSKKQRVNSSNSRSRSKSKSQSKIKPFNPKKYNVEPIDGADYSEEGASNKQNICCFGCLFHLQSFDASNNTLSRIKCELFKNEMSMAKYGFITDKYLFCANRSKMAVVDISDHGTKNVNENGTDKYHQKERQIAATVICEYDLPKNDVNQEEQNKIDKQHKEDEKKHVFGLFGSITSTLNDAVKVNVIATDPTINYAVFDHGDYIYCVRLIDNNHNNDIKEENNDNTNNRNNTNHNNLQTTTNQKRKLEILYKFDITKLGVLTGSRNRKIKQMLLWHNSRNEINVIIFGVDYKMVTINLSTLECVSCCNQIYLSTNYVNPQFKSVKLFDKYKNKAIICGMGNEFGILQLNDNGKHEIISRIMTKYKKKEEGYLRCGVWSNYCIIGAPHDNRIGIWDLDKKAFIKYVRIGSSSAYAKKKFNCWRIYELKQYKSFIALCATEETDFINRIYPK